jgi:catechol 2,3-dioxygenase-like lactoylglutathione lyase family enzyme
MHVLAARVLLRPTDMDATVDFYEHCVGLVRFREWGDAPHRGIVYFLGGAFLELTETPPGQPRPARPAGVRLWLQVEDVAKACAQLAARDVVVAEPPERKPWGLIEATVHDPDGLRLVIIETPLDHPLRRRD